MGMESLEKRLMKLLIAIILIGALVATVIVYSNTKPSNETVTPNKTRISEPTTCFGDKYKLPKDTE